MGRRISKEFLHPSILEGVNNKIGNLSELETDNKTDMVSAINELIVNIIDNFNAVEELNMNKQQMVDILLSKGIDCSIDNSFEELFDYIEKLEDTDVFKQELINILINKGFEVDDSITLEEAINSIEEATKIPLIAGTTGTYLLTLFSTYTYSRSDRYNSLEQAQSATGTVTFDDTKFVIKSATIKYERTCGGVTNNAYVRLEQIRDGAVIKTFFTKDSVNINNFGSYSATVDDIKLGDGFRIITYGHYESSSSVTEKHIISLTVLMDI